MFPEQPSGSLKPRIQVMLRPEEMRDLIWVENEEEDEEEEEEEESPKSIGTNWRGVLSNVLLGVGDQL